MIVYGWMAVMVASSTTTETILERLEDVEQRTRIIERKEEIAKEKAAEAAKTAKAPITVSAEPGRGFTVAAGDGSFSMNIVGRIVPRETLIAQNRPGPDKFTNEVNIRTARLNITGNVLVPEVRYQLQLAFGSSDFETTSSGTLLSPSPIFDAWVSWQPFRDLAITAGQYFVPFDRARTTREFALEFVDRQLAVQELSLDRDVGVTLSSQDLFGTSMLSYYLGIFGGDGRNRLLATRPGYLYVGRVSVRPFGPFDDDSEGDLERLDKVRLALGGGAAYNMRTDRPRSTQGTPFTLGTFDYWHFAGDLVFKYAGLAIFAEILYRDSKSDNHVGPTSTEYPRKAYGYFAQAGYMITKNVEVAARWGELRTFDSTDPALVRQIREQGRELGGCVSLYLNGHRFKLQLDYFHIFGEEFERGRDQVRLQLNLNI